MARNVLFRWKLDRSRRIPYLQSPNSIDGPVSAPTRKNDRELGSIDALTLFAVRGEVHFRVQHHHGNAEAGG